MTESDGSESTLQTPIAIIGMGCLLPGAQGLQEYWRLLRRSEDGIREVPSSHWSVADYFAPDGNGADLTYCRRGAFLSSIDFDPTEFGIPPATLEAIDTSQLLSLVVAKAAMQDAGYGHEREFDRSRTSVILGVTGTQEMVLPLGARMGHPIWRRALRACGVSEDVTESVVREISEAYVSWQENSFPGLLGNVVAGRIANRLDLRGTNCVVDAACASSLSAIHLSMLELSSGRSDLALSGGVDTLNDIFMFMCFSKTQALSPTGDARPFSKDADGTVIGEGVGMVVLKRLADAHRDGDRIYAVIRGMGSSSDGRSQSIYAPRSEGQAEALRSADRLGGVDPGTIEMVEGHGTGTRVGDLVEFEALKTVYRQARGRGTWCALGSVKSQIGHTKAAAGVAGLIKAALALHHQVLPPTIKVSEPNPEFEIASSPFYLNTEPRPWIATNAHPRRSCVSAFGFGGSNFHVVLEECANTEVDVAWDGSVDIIALSARSCEELTEKAAQWHKFSSESPARNVVAYRAKQSRDAFCPSDDQRLLLVVEHGADLTKLLAEAKKMLVAKDGEPTWSVANAFFGSSAADGKTAFLFPGQGSQYTGMGRDLVCTFPEARRAIAEAGHTSNKGRLSDYIYPVPAFEEPQRAEQAAALTRTDIAQPALGAVSLAMLRVLERFNVKADAVAGHSYGELVALRASGRIDDDTLRHLSEVRGRLMAEGTGDRGTMTAVRAPLDQIERMLAEEKIDVVLAHRNSPTQGILSGRRDAIERATRACASRGWRSTPLNVSGAFHSELMAEAAKRFRELLHDVSITNGSTTVYANRTAEAYPDDPEQARELLASQLVNPVNFAKQIENMYAAGVRVFVEVGPKAVLTGLVRGILGDRSYQAIALDAGCGRRCQVADLARVLARLAAWGRPVGLTKWEPDCPEPVKPKMVIPLTGVNYRSTGSNRSDAGVPRIAIRGLGTESAKDIAKSDESINTTQVHSVLQVVQEGLRAMQALQQQTAAAHQRFLETQEQAQKTFQMVMEGQQRLVERTLGLAPAAPSEIERSTPQQSASAVAVDPPSQGIAMAQSSTPPAESPYPAAEIVGSEHEIEQALIEVVSETTGYPLESISLEMELDEDLGIDRVRRMDVLSRLGQRVRTARQLNGSQVDRLRTLQDIVAYTVSGSMPDEPAPTPKDASVTETEPAAATDGAIETNDLEKTLLDVVARLTGYPLEMLDPDMDLEADLGIDSIKRVEILAEVQSRIPAMATVDSSYIGSLRTLRNIVEYMKSPAADGAGTDSAAAVEPACAPSQGELGETLADDGRLERRVLRAVTLQKLVSKGEIAIAAGREIWIVDDGTALPRALNDRFKSLNISSRVVSPLVEVGGNGDARIGGLVYLARPRTQDQAVWREEAEDDLKVAFMQAQRVCSMLGDAAAAGGALFATISRMDGAFGLIGGSYDPVQGGLAGLTKTFAQEWPDVCCKALDVAGTWSDVDAIAEAVIAELGSQGPIEVGLDGETRRGLESVVSEVAEGRLELNPGDVVVVSGGARGVTAEAAHALALACRPTLVLLGRSPAPEPEPDWLAGLSDEAKIKRALLEHAFAGDEKPNPARLESAYRKHLANREVAANIERLERAGARVLYRSVDLRDGAAVREVMKRARREAGPVRALIHGAGVIDDRLITDKTMERFERVFDTKVAGLRHLLESVEADALKYLVLFTSVSGRFGRQGQVDYAMANEVLNKVAQRYKATQPSWHVTAINWGPWDGGMVTGSLKRDFARQGIGLIPLEEGARRFIAEMSRTDSDDVEIMIGAPFPQAEGSDAASANVVTSNSAGELSTTFERRLDVERHGFLASHVIGGHPVLPVAIMLEWLGHGALHDNPGLLLYGFDDFRLLKGVILSDGPRDLRVVATKARRKGELYEVDVELHSVSEGGVRVHARTRAILVSALPTPTVYSPREVHDVKPYGRSVQEIYDEILFHGPHFHAIDRVESICSEGMTARVRSAPAPAAWMADPPRSAWLGDPLIVDAGLQLGILWCHETLNSVSLPSFGARYRQYRSPFPTDGVSAVLATRENGRRRMTADVTFIDGESRVIARMEGFKWTMAPALGAAFGRASVAGATGA